MGYATLADFEIHGLRREVLLPRARTVLSVDAATDTLAVSSHGWSGSEALSFSAIALGGTAPVLPGGLSSTVVYRPLPVTDSDQLFQLSLTIGGAAVDITDAGVGQFAITEQLGPKILAVLDMWSALLAEDLVDYTTPIVAPFPPSLVWVVCKLAALDIAVTQGLVVPTYWQEARETISAQAEAAQKLRDEWRAGKPLQGITADATPGTSENGTATLEPIPGAAPTWFSSICGQEAIS